MKQTIDETNRRREIQIKYNQEHNITPQPLNKKINALNASAEQFEMNPYQRKPLNLVAAEDKVDYGKMSQEDKEKKIAELQKKMEKAATNLDFMDFFARRYFLNGCSPIDVLYILSSRRCPCNISSPSSSLQSLCPINKVESREL